MGDNGGPSIKGFFGEDRPDFSPGGDIIQCPCGTRVSSDDVHRSFVFWHSPADIEHAPLMGGVQSEWRPKMAYGDPVKDDPKIPGDEGPNRVAYWINGFPTVQVHSGPDTGSWLPCYSYPVTREGMPYQIWVCRRSHVSEPCDEDFMRGIST